MLATAATTTITTSTELLTTTTISARMAATTASAVLAATTTISARMAAATTISAMTTATMVGTTQGTMRMTTQVYEFVNSANIALVDAMLLPMMVLAMTFPCHGVRQLASVSRADAIVSSEHNMHGGIIQTSLSSRDRFNM